MVLRLVRATARTSRTRSLPHREVLTLFFLEDLSIEEVATILGGGTFLGVPPGTVKSRLYYAKQALRKVIEGEVSRHE